MFRTGGHFNSDGSFDFHGSFSGFDGLPPGYRAPMPRFAIAGMSKAPMKTRSTTIEITFESAVVLRALEVPRHCVDVLIESIRVDGHDLLVDTSHIVDLVHGPHVRGIPYAAIHSAQEHGSFAIGSTVAHRKVTIVAKRWVERHRRLEIRRRGSNVRCKFVERVVSRTSRSTRFCAVLQCMVLPQDSKRGAG